MRFLSSLVLVVCAGHALAGVEDFAFPTVDTAAQFDRMSVPGGSIVRTGRTLRFVIDNRPGREPRILYVHGGYKDETGKTPDYVRYHFDFTTRAFEASLREFLKKGPDDEFDSEDIEKYNLASYFTKESKRFVAGTIKSYSSAGGTIYAVQFYPQDKANERQILDTMDLVHATFHARGDLYFVATGAQQTVRTVARNIAEIPARVTTIDRIFAESPYFAVEMGEVTGVLKRAGDALDPWDIAIFDDVPTSPPVVAGAVLRRIPANDSPFTLRAKERKAPSFYVKSDARLTRFVGQAVKITVDEGDFTIAPYAGDPEADWRKSRPAASEATWNAAPRDRDVVAIDRVCAGQKPARCLADAAAIYGVRAANLAYLESPPTLRFAAQRLKVTPTRLGAQLPSGVAVSALLAHRVALGEKAAQRILAAGIAAALPHVETIRIQPSPSEADLADWEGPGRFESRVVKASDGSAVTSAIMEIYRALESDAMTRERSALSKDTTHVAAGLLITSEEGAEQSDLAGEIITRVVNVKDVYGYTWAAQAGSAPVVTLPAGADSVEGGVATFGRDWELDTALGFSPVRFAAGSRDTSLLQDRAGEFPSAVRDLVKLVAAFEIRYCLDVPSYYPLPKGSRADKEQVCLGMPPDNKKPSAMAVGFQRAGGQFRITGFRRFLGH